MTYSKISPGPSAAAAFVLALAGCTGANGESAKSPEESSGASAPGIEIEYIAHASFLMRAEDGTELLIDPYASRVWLGYDWPDGIAPNAILITHPHYDHDAGRYREMPFPWSDEVPIVDAPGETAFGAFTVTGVRGKHADPYGMEFGQLNTLMIVEAHGLRIAHLGDNGPLTAEMIQGLGRVDVLMMPGDAVDHIISPETTEAILTELDPSVVIPMHYRLPDLEVSEDSPSDLGDIEPWLEGRARVRRLSNNSTKLSISALPAEREYLVFAHAPYVVGPTG
jgi:L-ascorbate metabolism protein UlaG (beta-lactamase superfamily)